MEKSVGIVKETKDAIENLSDDQVYDLLDKKWIAPLLAGLSDLSKNVIDDFTSKLEKISEKYDTTFSSVEDQIKETEKELSAMIDQLTGSEFDMQGLAEFKKMLGDM